MPAHFHQALWQLENSPILFNQEHNSVLISILQVDGCLHGWETNATVASTDAVLKSDKLRTTPYNLCFKGTCFRL